MRGNEHQKICELVDDYIDGNLNTNDNKIFETHLKKCSKCHNYVEKYREIQTFITQKKAVCIPDDADMRIRMSLRTEINENTSDKNVLDIEDVAQLLNITVSDVVDMLDELPAFEISGRIRFRRQSIEKWIKTKETELSWGKTRTAINLEKNIFKFPGGN